MSDSSLLRFMSFISTVVGVWCAYLGMPFMCLWCFFMTGIFRWLITLGED